MNLEGIQVSQKFDENLMFDGVRFRTTRINEAVQLMYLINEQLDSNKKETNQNISNLSLMVEGQRFEPFFSLSSCGL